MTDCECGQHLHHDYQPLHTGYVGWQKCSACGQQIFIPFPKPPQAPFWARYVQHRWQVVQHALSTGDCPCYDCGEGLGDFWHVTP